MPRKIYSWNPVLIHPDSDEVPECFVCHHFPSIKLAVGPSLTHQGPLGAFGATPKGFKAVVYSTEHARVVDAPNGLSAYTLQLGEVHFTSTMAGAKRVAIQMGKMLAPVMETLRRDRRQGKGTQRVPVEFGTRRGWLLYPASLIPEDEPEETPSLAESGTWPTLED